MSTSPVDTRSPEEIEREIAVMRQSLHSKLHEIEDRLSPKAQLRRVQDRVQDQVTRVRRQVHPSDYVGWAALGAVATGAYLAVKGLRRRREDPFSDLDGENGLLFVQADCEEDEIAEPPLL